MADRKVLNKYFPKNFDHERIVKRGRGKQKLMIVRNMLPMSLRCNTCSNYLYIGTKFNMRMQICNDQVYLGIKVFRFYLKCTYCYADITFKTDPKNHDYVVEDGGTRNYEPIKDAQQAEKLLKKMKINQKQGDSMKYLQNKTYDSKRQMQLTETLEDIKSLNKRQGVIDPEDLLKNIIYMQEEELKMTEEQEQQIDTRWKQLCQKNLQRRLRQLKQNQRKGQVSNAIRQEDNQDGEEQQYHQGNQNQPNGNYSDMVPTVEKPQQSIGLLTSNGLNSLGSSNGKKIVMPTKSKLDKFKKKIIKKQPKQEQQKNRSNDQNKQKDQP